MGGSVCLLYIYCTRSCCKNYLVYWYSRNLWSIDWGVHLPLVSICAFVYIYRSAITLDLAVKLGTACENLISFQVLLLLYSRSFHMTYQRPHNNQNKKINLHESFYSHSGCCCSFACCCCPCVILYTTQQQQYEIISTTKTTANCCCSFACCCCPCVIMYTTQQQEEIISTKKQQLQIDRNWYIFWSNKCMTHLSSSSTPNDSM